MENNDGYFSGFMQGVANVMETVMDVSSKIVICSGCRLPFDVGETDIGSADILRKMGLNYVNIWKCSNCVVVGSQNAREVTRKLKQLQLAEIIIKLGSVEEKLEERPSNSRERTVHVPASPSRGTGRAPRHRLQ